MVTIAKSMVDLATVESVLSTYIFGIVWGIADGAVDVLAYMVPANYFGRTAYTIIVGAFKAFEAIGLGIGHGIGPVIYDVTGNYSFLTGLLLALYVLAALLIVMCRSQAAPVMPSNAKSLGRQRHTW